MSDEPDIVATRTRVKREGGVAIRKPDSAVDQAVAARIARARQKELTDRQRRAELKAARDAGLRARHAAKLAHLAAQEAAGTPHPKETL